MSSIRCKKGWWYYRYYDATGKLRERALRTRNRETAERLKTFLDTQLEINEQIELYLNATLGFMIEHYLNYLFPQKFPQRMKDYQILARRLKDYYHYPVMHLKQTHISEMIKNLEQGYLEGSAHKTLMFLKLANKRLS